MKAWELQEAVRARLVGFAALTALVSTRVYDHVPQSSAFPYVVLGEDNSTEDDTFSRIGSDHLLTLHVWTRDSVRGFKQAKQIQQALIDALHQHSLVVSGASTIDCVWESNEVFPDPDGLTRHGVSRFRVNLAQS